MVKINRGLCLGAVAAALFVAAADGKCNPKLAPPLCSGPDFQHCDKDKDLAGCSTGKFCYPKMTGDGTCPAQCPPICKAGEQFCPGVTRDGKKCPEADVCKAETGPAPLNCPVYCPKQCAADEQECPGVRKADNPCLPEPICIKKTGKCPTQTIDEKGCTILSKVPPTCTAGKIPCDGGWDVKGCKKPMVCKTPLVAHSAKCAQKCPAACHEGMEKECPTTYDINGCPEDKVCARWSGHCPANKFKKDDGCPLMKEPKCPEGEKLCPQDAVLKASLNKNPAVKVFDATATCALPKKCTPKKMKGSDCENPCTRLCADENPKGPGLLQKKACPGLRNNKGCRADTKCEAPGASCQSESYDEKGCPINPPTSCTAQEEKCTGLYQPNGCQLADTCIPKDDQCTCPAQTHNSKGCPLSPPKPTCSSPKGLSCPKKPNALGCDLGTECMNNVDGAGCNTICSLHCDVQGKQQCVKTVDAGGCPTAYECVAKMMTGEKAHCPAVCPNTFCGKDKKVCKTFDSLGCPQARCIPKADKCTSDYDAKGCYVLEKLSCDAATEKECKGVTDAKGCEQAGYCEVKSEPCDAPCNLGTEEACGRGNWDGKYLGEHCVKTDAYSAIWENIICKVQCPVACDWHTQKACHGGFSKLTGCPLQDSCEDKIRACKTPANFVRDLNAKPGTKKKGGR